MEFLGQILVFVLFILLAAVVAYGLRNSFMGGHTDPTARGGRRHDDGRNDASRSRSEPDASRAN